MNLFLIHFQNHGSDMHVYANSWLLHDGARNHAARQLVFESI